MNLRRQGFEVWYPRQKKTVRHARRRIDKLVSFFPGYQFVFLDIERDRWRSVNGTMGVRSLVMQGGLPCPCPRGLVERLQDLTDADGLLDMSAHLTEGGTVRILSGPFADAVCTLISLDGAARARVLLQLLHGEVVVSINKSFLTPA